MGAGYGVFMGLIDLDLFVAARLRTYEERLAAARAERHSTRYSYLISIYVRYMGEMASRDGVFFCGHRRGRGTTLFVVLWVPGICGGETVRALRTGIV